MDSTGRVLNPVAELLIAKGNVLIEDDKLQLSEIEAPDSKKGRLI